ncbi:MAG: DOMON domain-containing protein [Candidatus Thermoplasmatota archaeon]|nr:DOMON domain-containing protein [Candidatus Thermoplasmatota archaeon]
MSKGGPYLFRRSTPWVVMILFTGSVMTLLFGQGMVSVVEEPQSRATPLVDGSIGGTEYEDSINVDEGKFELFWTTTGADIYIGMRAKVTGWISLGLDPVNIMTNSDMIFGGVSGGTPYIIDAWCTDDEGNHPEDTTFSGGSYDIDSYDATEGVGTTTVEFKRAMSTGDPYDKKFVNGTSIKIMWATHNDDDDWSNAKHDDADYTTIKMDGTPPPPPPASKDLDGVITAGEYKNSTTYNSGAFQLYWNVSGPNITIALKAQVTGWISLGISPVSMMQGADFIIGGYSTLALSGRRYRWDRRSEIVQRHGVWRMDHPRSEEGFDDHRYEGQTHPYRASGHDHTLGRQQFGRYECCTYSARIRDLEGGERVCTPATASTAPEIGLRWDSLLGRILERDQGQQ